MKTHFSNEGLYAWCERGTDDWHYFNDGQPVTKAEYQRLSAVRFGTAGRAESVAAQPPASAPAALPAAPTPQAVRQIPQLPAGAPQLPAQLPQTLRAVPQPVRAATPPPAPQPTQPGLSPHLAVWSAAQQARIDIARELQRPGLTSEMRRQLQALDRQACALMAEANEAAKPKMDSGKKAALLRLTKLGKATLKHGGSR